MERAIFISSVNRETIGDASSHNFKIKFTPTLRLPSGMTHSLVLDKLSMTYSWHNITPAHKNNTLKYSHDAGYSWSTITFPSGAYSYGDLNQFIKEFIMYKGHSVSDKGEIRFTFVLTTYRIVIELDDNFQLDLRGNTFCELIGFSPKIITSTEYGTKLPNITNSVDAFHILTDVVEESLVDGKLSRYNVCSSGQAISDGLIHSELNHVERSSSRSSQALSMKYSFGFKMHLAGLWISTGSTGICL